LGEKQTHREEEEEEALANSLASFLAFVVGGRVDVFFRSLVPFSARFGTLCG
jgi:hypothetical protein